jgi:hypothetical protein
MALISTKLHGAGDYATGLGLLAAPTVLRMRDGLASVVLRGTGASILALSAVTDYELGLRRRLPVRAHLRIDAATGALLTVGALGLRRRGRGVANWLPHGLVGVGEVGAALLTAREPGDRQAAPSVAAPRSEPTPGAAPASPEPPSALGPTPPQPPATARHAALPPHSENDDILLAREEAAAAAEAAAIGGRGSTSVDDPAMDPVYQAGGGEQEGWEQAEAELIENASHGDGVADPRADAFPPEREADRAGAAYGEADSLHSTEVTEDEGAEEDASGTPPPTA